MSNNKNLQTSKNLKDDEFYTLYDDIEAELKHYDLKDKLIYANCDQSTSNFVTYFAKKKLNYIHTCSDFRNADNIELLKRADVIITNPPFSLFREYIQLLLDNDKQFLIVGNLNISGSLTMINAIVHHNVVVGINYVKKFIRPDKSTISMGNIIWYTNIENNYIKPFITLDKEYDPKLYPTYDDYDAINVDKVIEIPYDYKGLMGVPISFLTVHNPKQFKIVDIKPRRHINGIEKYCRVIVKRL